VASSNVHVLTRRGAEVVLSGPPDLVPDVAASLEPGTVVSHDLDAALAGADVVMSLRVQKERLGGKQISERDYIERYQIDSRRMKLAKRDAILLHPGPVIRGMELTSEVADGPQSLIHEQVENGVKMRMAILATVAGKGR
jgi:aspartate carbamoyltransferase catalytic subunit